MPAIASFIQLSAQDILANIPHDAGAFVAYAILALFVGFIWIGSRPKKAGDGTAGEAGRTSK